MPPPLIDTHAHLDAEQFHSDLRAVLNRAQAAGLVQILTVATTADSSSASIALAQQHDLVLASVGIHPTHIAQEPPDAWDRVRALVGEPKVVALGETGLDRYWDSTPFHQQEEFFARHLELSRETGLPVVIHCRDAEADMLRMLREEFERHGPLRGVMHSFSSDRVHADAYQQMGLHISFSGMITRKKAEAVRAAAVQVAAERLLVETDSPYITPVPLRGRNEPAYVARTAEVLAEVRGVAVDTIAQQTTENARRLFGDNSEGSWPGGKRAPTQ